MSRPWREQGAALFAVLALCALLAAFATLGIGRLRAATDSAATSNNRAQARLIARGAVMQLKSDLTALKTAIAKDPSIMTRAQVVPIDGGRVLLRVADGGNCFNLNSLTDRTEEVTGSTPEQFARLLVAVGVPDTDASRLARATAAWTAANGVMRADPSEWAAMPGVTPKVWAAAAPLLCTQPSREPSQVNLNTLTPDQIPLLATMGLSADAARRALERRPATGFDDPAAFWKAATGREEPPRVASAAAASLTPRWFRLDVTVELNGERLRQRALIDTATTPIKVAAVEWE